MARRSLGQRVVAVVFNARNDIRRFENCDCYALQIGGLTFGVWALFNSKTEIAILLAFLIIVIAEVLRNRHSKDMILKSLDTLEEDLRTLRDEVGDPELFEIKKRLSPIDPVKPRLPTSGGHSGLSKSTDVN